MKTRKRGGGIFNSFRKLNQNKIDAIYKYINTNLDYIKKIIHDIKLLQENSIKEQKIFTEKLIQLSARAYLLLMFNDSIITDFSSDEVINISKNIIHSTTNDLINICIKINRPDLDLYCNGEKLKAKMDTKNLKIKRNTVNPDVDCQFYPNIAKTCKKYSEPPRIKKYIDVILNYIKYLIDCKINLNDNNIVMNNTRKQCIKTLHTIKHNRSEKEKYNTLVQDRANALKERKNHQNKKNCGLIYDIYDRAKLVNIKNDLKYNSQCRYTYKTQFEEFCRLHGDNPKYRDNPICQEIAAERKEAERIEAERIEAERIEAEKKEAETTRKPNPQPQQTTATNNRNKQPQQTTTANQPRTNHNQPTTKPNQTQPPIKPSKPSRILLKNTYETSTNPYIKRSNMTYENFLGKLTSDQQKDLKFKTAYLKTTKEQEQAINFYLGILNGNNYSTVYGKYKNYPIEHYRLYSEYYIDSMLEIEYDTICRNIAANKYITFAKFLGMLDPIQIQEIENSKNIYSNKNEYNVIKYGTKHNIKNILTYYINMKINNKTYKIRNNLNPTYSEYKEYSFDRSPSEW